MALRFCLILPAACRSFVRFLKLGIFLRMVFFHNAVLDSLLLRVFHLTVSVLCHTVRMLLVKLNAPFEEEFQVYPHRMDAGFHDNKITLRQGFQLVGCQQRTLNHLQALGGIVLRSADRSGHYRAAAECFGQGFRRAAVGREAAEQGDLRVVYNDFGAFLSVVLNLVINETEAVVVRRIFSMYLQGYGKQAIANKLNEESVPRRHGTKLWYAFGIDYMLNNERYMGDALLQKKYTTDTLPFKKVKNRGERPKYYVENANPAIVSRETYTAVQELQKSRQKNMGGKKTSYPLTGMLRCPDCGRSYRRQIVRGRAYWLCSGRASGATICSSQRMAESDVHEAFNKMLFKLKKHHHAILGALIRDIEVMQSKTSENHEKIAEIDKEIADLAARNLVIVRLHTSGILNGSDYSAQSSEINNRISALRSERKKKLAEDEGDEQLDKLKELQSILDEYEPTEAFDEDLFHQIIEKAVVMSKSGIAFYLIGGLTSEMANMLPA